MGCECRLMFAILDVFVNYADKCYKDADCEACVIGNVTKRTGRSLPNAYVRLSHSVLSLMYTLERIPPTSLVTVPSTYISHNPHPSGTDLHDA